ncbi:probable serine hydrolase [Prorops nasuta]|uniref:probable serine hydrolase n=1 Tax=Prorops nasuta TaxID=863751 RepID=UPI0034D01E2E
MALRHIFNRNTQIGIQSTKIRKLHYKEDLVNECSSEVEINVPWGKIAGKIWGKGDKQPILALHGWQDNAGTFDNLAPLLTERSSIFAIDFPGHGLSSWLSPGSYYNGMLYLITIERIRLHYGWKKVKLLGHSMGANLSFIYAGTFPSQTEFVVSVDGLKPESTEVLENNKLISKAFKDLFKAEDKKMENPVYLENEAIRRWVEGTNKSVNETACKILMKRGAIEKEKGKFAFSRDPILKYWTHFGMVHEQYQNMARLICCPYMVIKATDSPYFDKKYAHDDILDILKRTSADFWHTVVPGKHHVHLTNPKVVAESILPFIKKYD